MAGTRTVAITGMGAVCALGASVAEIAAALYEDAPIRRLRLSAVLMNGGTAPLEFPILTVPDGVWTQPRNGSGEDTLLLGMHAAREALAQAACSDREMAVVAGTTSGTALHFLKGYAQFREQGTKGPDCDSYLISNPSLAMASALGLTGPRITVSNACVSGTDAIGIAAGMIASGRCSSALCGGMDALSIVPHTGFARLMIYDEAPCRPYDAGRCGLNLGEGAAFLVLEDAGSARERGAEILGYVEGYASAGDAHHFTAPHPDGAGLERALASAGLTGREHAFINVHGTGTRENDKVEGRALARIFPGTPLWSTKALTGHALGAAGALEAVFTLVALRARKVPASAGFSVPDEEIGASPTTAPLSITASTAVSTSLGFGGSNSVIGIRVD